MKSTWKKRFRQHWVILKFGPLFLFLIALFFVLVGHRFFSEVVPLERYFTMAVTQVSGTSLDLIGFDNRVEGTMIHCTDAEAPNPRYSVDLQTGCNGLVATLIFMAAVLAFPASFRDKILGILAGALILQSFNLVRVGVLYYLGLYHKDLFETVHVYVAQSILIAIAAALWLLWSIRAGKETRTDGS